jgi:transposase-like protein
MAQTNKVKPAEAKFSKEKKQEIVAYAKNHTVSETALKFGINESKINRWKEKFGS